MYMCMYICTHTDLRTTDQERQPSTFQISFPILREEMIRNCGRIKVVELGDLELTNTPPLHHEHIKTTTTCRASFSENNLMTSRTAALQPRL